MTKQKQWVKQEFISYSCEYGQFWLAWQLHDHQKISYQEGEPGNSLVVQCLRLQVSTAGGIGLTPGWGAKILHASQPKN